MTNGKVIPGIKLIRHNAGGVNEQEDPTLPYKLEANLRPPEFMEMAFVGLYGGSEEIVVQGQTHEALEKFSQMNELQTHSRLRNLKIKGPDFDYEYPPKKEGR